MATKVDQSSPVEPRHVQSATSSASSPKVSKFGTKSGFVIPKNKLSGSLVPIFRAGKVDAGNTIKEENTKQVQRKTKWGTDLTQDPAVRKGRLLAYQTRVEQITQQLKAGALEITDDQGSQSPKQPSNNESASVNLDNKVLESLELERREIIGEILCLNPSYKAPPDYKPLLKEAKVPIPVKAYPGNNFIGLLLGPESNTQKRLEEETGARIRVHGTKADTREKREITPADIHEARGAYEELYVNVSADTYEKVDVTVALIELLLTPVSGVSPTISSSAAGGNADTKDPSKESGQPNQPQFQLYPRLVPAQTAPYTSPWFPNPQYNIPYRPPAGFMPSPFRNNPAPPYFRQPVPFGLISGPAARLTQLPAQMQRPPNQFIPPQNRPMPGQQPLPASRPTVSLNLPMYATRPPSVTPLLVRPISANPTQVVTPPRPVSFSSVPPQVRPVSVPPPVVSISPLRATVPPPTPRPLVIPIASVPTFTHVPQTATQPPSTVPFASSAPTTPIPRPPRPSSGDFTFQPRRAQVPASPTPLAAPQAPSFRPAVQTPQGFPWSTSAPLPRIPFPNPGVATAPPTQMGPPSFSPVHHVQNSSTPMQVRPGSIAVPSRQPVLGFGPPPVGGNQIYDPFSPSSLPPHQGSELTKAKKPEPDAEYEDLMASVGVK